MEKRKLTEGNDSQFTDVFAQVKIQVRTERPD